jgi:hypothetical protein
VAGTPKSATDERGHKLVTHSDVQPYWPWAAGNPLLGVVGLTTLHLSCVAAGVVAVGILLAKAAAERRTG